MPPGGSQKKTKFSDPNSAFDNTPLSVDMLNAIFVHLQHDFFLSRWKTFKPCPQSVDINCESLRFRLTRPNRRSIHSISLATKFRRVSVESP